MKDFIKSLFTKPDKPAESADDAYLDLIEKEYYFTAAEGVAGSELFSGGLTQVNGQLLVIVPRALGYLTFCVLILRTGRVVTGEAHSTSFESYDEKKAKYYAHKAALARLRVLLGEE